MARLVERTTKLETEYQDSLRKTKLPRIGRRVLLALSVGGFVIPGIAQLFSWSNWLWTTGWDIQGIAFVGMMIAALWNKLIPSARTDILRSGIEGETLTREILRELPDDYTIVPDVMVKTSTGSAQLDFVVISRKGIWIVECKHMNGVIYGSYGDQQWRQDKIGRQGGNYSKLFYNPVKQVRTHVSKLKQYLQESGIGQIPWIQPVVYFSNDAVSVFAMGNENHPVLRGRSALLDYFFEQEQQANKVDEKHIKEILACLG